MSKVKKEKFKVYNDVFEPITIKALRKLQSNGYFDVITKEISLGKEANVFLAKKGEEPIILKIYRIGVMDFKKLKDYFLLDPRFPKVRNSRYDLIFNWTKKEYRNLVKAYKEDVRVPIPITSYKNILVEEFIGDKETLEPSPKLKDYYPITEEIFFDLVDNLKKMVFNAGVIHGDLSEYNILIKDDKPVIIDLSQSVPYYSTKAYELLKRDIEKLNKFFSKHINKKLVDSELNEILNNFKKEI